MLAAQRRGRREALRQPAGQSATKIKKGATGSTRFVNRTRYAVTRTEIAAFAVVKSEQQAAVTPTQARSGAAIRSR